MCLVVRCVHTMHMVTQSTCGRSRTPAKQNAMDMRVSGHLQKECFSSENLHVRSNPYACHVFACVQTGGALVMITVVLFDLVTVSM